jgi:hypothetical protein
MPDQYVRFCPFLPTCKEDDNEGQENEDELKLPGERELLNISSSSDGSEPEPEAEPPPETPAEQAESVPPGTPKPHHHKRRHATVLKAANDMASASMMDQLPGLGQN